MDEQDVWFLRGLDECTGNGRETNKEKCRKPHGEKLSWSDMSVYKEGKDAWIRRTKPIAVAGRGDSIRGLSLPAFGRIPARPLFFDYASDPQTRHDRRQQLLAKPGSR